jgi:hypothetical protein
VGVKSTLTAHEPFAGMLETQVFVCEKSPVTEMPQTVVAVLAVLVIVVERAALVEPTI